MYRNDPIGQNSNLENPIGRIFTLLTVHLGTILCNNQLDARRIPLAEFKFLESQISLAV
jgi:hypothetical protein